MDTERTFSEQLFEAFCRAHHLPCEQIPRSGGRTADYRVTLVSGTVIAEVKELQPGPADERITCDVVAHGIAASVLTPGARVRQEITDARKQLRAEAKGRHPALLVLYDNTGGLTGAIAPHDVLVAMYGEERVEPSVTHESTGVSRDDRFIVGGNRGVDRAENTTLSAIGVLVWGPDAPRLDVYHNCYAALPLTIDALPGPGVRHFVVTAYSEGSFREWLPA